MTDRKKIVVTGGGTGGHLFPAIALAEELAARGYTVHLITDARCKKYLRDINNIKYHIIDVKVNYKNLLTKFLSVLSLLSSTFKALVLLNRIKPSATIGFGGYPVFAPLCAAVIMRIPIVLHEPNSILGKLNKMFLPIARALTLSYKNTKGVKNKAKVKIIGGVVRNSIKNLNRKANFDDKTFRILIFGGSIGAKVFATLIPESIRLVVVAEPKVKLQITQQASAVDHDNITKIYDSLNIDYKLAEFFYDIDKYYADADLAITRAGASTISELTAIALPGIFIPYPYAADNHQFYNAKALEDMGCGWCFVQKSVTSKIIADKILELIRNKNIIREAEKNLLKTQKNGNKTLADTVEKIIN